MNAKRGRTIEGVGSVFGGEMEFLTIEGIGKLRGKANIGRLSVEGLFKSKGHITAERFSVEGIARLFRSVKAGEVSIDGVMKLRRASLTAKKIKGDGVLVCTGEVSADEVYWEGILSAARLFGDKIELAFRDVNQNGKASHNAGMLLRLGRLYFGRRLSMEESLVDLIECTELTARRLTSRTVRAGAVYLSDGCRIKKLYCDGPIIVDDTCRIEEIIGKGVPICQNRVESSEKPEKKESEAEVQQLISEAKELAGTAARLSEEAMEQAEEQGEQAAKVTVRLEAEIRQKAKGIKEKAKNLSRHQKTGRIVVETTVNGKTVREEIVLDTPGDKTAPEREMTEAEKALAAKINALEKEGCLTAEEAKAMRSSIS